MDSNRLGRDSNRLLQSALSGKWIRIALGGIQIAFISPHFLESGFESPSLNLLEKAPELKSLLRDSNLLVRDSNLTN